MTVTVELLVHADLGLPAGVALVLAKPVTLSAFRQAVSDVHRPRRSSF